MKHARLSTYISELQSRGRYSFAKEEALSALGCSNQAFILSANRLHLKDSLAHVKNGFYINITPEHRAVGSLPADWFIHDLMNFLHKPYYVALLSAASYYGAAHQQPQIFQVITTTQINEIKLGRVTIRFVYKKDFPNCGLQSFNSYTGSVQVSSPELTALDICDYPEHAGFIQNIAQVISDLAPSISEGKLGKQIKSQYTKTTLLQRLGYMFELAHHDKLADIVYKAFSQRTVKKYIDLAPGEDSEGSSKNKRWKLNINEEIELDI